MIKKFILCFLILFNFSYAAFEQVRVGKIDAHYKNTLTKKQVIKLILEIRDHFEEKLGFSVFEYNQSGKDIDILYYPPSLKKRKIINYNKELTKLQKKILKKKELLKDKEKKLEKLKKLLNDEAKMINTNTKSLNRYIKKQNKKKSHTKEEYKLIKTYISKQNNFISKLKNSFKKEKRKIKTYLISFNQKLSIVNNLIKRSNFLNKKLENLNKNYIEKKGLARGNKKIQIKTYYKNGKKIQEKIQTTYMQKIEVFSFSNISELKTILAHELAHLVGLGHVNVKGALMNPILQKNQIKELSLHKVDIENFKKVFSKF